jgi:ArsR family transcriptional regulator
LKKTLEILKALSDENRLRIVLMLKEKKLCVCELHEVLEDISNSTLSAHLKTLRFAGIVNQEKAGRWIYYSLEKNKNLHALIGSIEEGMENRETPEKDREKIRRSTPELCSAKK